MSKLYQQKNLESGCKRTYFINCLTFSDPIGYQRRIQNPVERLRWRVLQKYFMAVCQNR